MLMLQFSNSGFRSTHPSAMGMNIYVIQMVNLSVNYFVFHLQSIKYCIFKFLSKWSIFYEFLPICSTRRVDQNLKLFKLQAQIFVNFPTVRITLVVFLEHLQVSWLTWPSVLGWPWGDCGIFFPFIHSRVLWSLSLHS